jgi:hypothetical protein
MDDSPSAARGPKKTAKPVTTAPIRVLKETRKRVLMEVAKANRKDLGRLVVVDDLITMALSLVQPEHIQQIQDSTLSNGDRLELRYREHVKKSGAISKDEFVGLMMRGELVGGNSVETKEL